MIRLDILSDPICPWCAIGKARLDAAVAEAGRDPFERRWRPFRLNPDMPPEGMDRRAYLEAKFGGPEAAADIHGRIAEAARGSGLDLDFSRIARTPDTLDAHRLIRWAEVEGAQERVVSELFRRYFEEGEDISDPAVLAGAAGRAGMDTAVVERLLAGDADREAVAEEDRAAREMGVTGVPTFLIDGRYVLQGAQDTATWVNVIRELEAALAERESGADEAGPGAGVPRG
jgi:predicted DsbA family dithiol-disulfide isomerase